MPTVLPPVVDTSEPMQWWVEPNGIVHPLDGSEGVLLMEGSRGRGLPPIELVQDPAPFAGGAVLRDTYVRPRPLTFDMWFGGTSAAQFRAVLDAAYRWFDPTRGDGRFRNRKADGTTRELWCRRSGGLEGDEGKGKVFFQVDSITLEATEDPYVYDTDETTVLFQVEDALGFFDAPFFPIKLLTSTVLGAVILNNNGHAEAWPVWTITGPGTNPTFRNNTTGMVTTVATSLVAGQQLIVDTRRAARRPKDSRGRPLPAVRDNLGGNLRYLLSSQVMWPLAVGSNSLQVEMSGATADSLVELTYVRRWLGL